MEEIHEISSLHTLSQQLLQVCLLGMACEVVFAPKSLGTKLAQEVLTACVDHHVAPHVFPGVEQSIAVVAPVLLLLVCVGLVFGVGLEMDEQHLGVPEHQGAHPAGEVAAVGLVEGHVPLVAQRGVVLLPTLLTHEGHLVGVMGLEVVLQMVFPVERLLTQTTLVRLLGRVGSCVPRSRRQNFTIDPDF